MTTIIIDEKSKKGKIVIDLIRELGIGKIIEDDRPKRKVNPNAVTLKAIKEAYEGNTIKCDSFQDYLKKAR
jgi:hypothetical protein